VILNLEQKAIKILLPTNSTGQININLTTSPFSEKLIDELSQLGTFLMINGRTVSSIVAAGYWLRKSHLHVIKSQYQTEQLKAKGTVFHIAPGNVDTLFFYSMITSVLCGNQTVLRISNKLSEDTQKLLTLINQCFSELGSNSIISSLMTVIQYDYNDVITGQISAASVAKVIWGNDDTIEYLSQFPLRANIDNNSANICFPDRYSVAVIQINDETQVLAAVDNLLRDIKPYIQQACSSPKIVYWLNTAQCLQDKFWQTLDSQLIEQESLETTDLVSQLLYTQRLPLLLETKKINKNNCQLKQYSLLQVMEVESVTFASIKSHVGLWILLSLQIDELNDIALFEHCQTVTMSGIKQAQWQGWLNSVQQPMKRIVPAGQALAFSHVWDGIDLIDALTK